MYVYFFLNSENEIIYIGRSKYLIERVHRHFQDSHLPQECIEETATVLYMTLQSENEMKLYEIYCIAKFQPKYNRDFTLSHSVEAN